MKNRFGILVVLAILAVPLTAFGQTEEWYSVRQNDTLWALKGAQWEELLKLNPWLEEQGRVKREGPGKTNVLIYPVPINGIGGDKLRVTPDIKAVIQSVPASMPSENPTDATAPQTYVIPSVTNEQAGSGFNYWWLLLLLVPLGILAYLARRNHTNLPFLGRFNPALHANPITSGPPVVAGGVSSDDHDAIRQRTREVAARSYTDARGVTPSWDRVEIVGPIQRGRLFGPWETMYRGGSWVPRNYNGEPGFQAMVRINGEEPTMQTWSQECGNDLRSGTRYRGGRFEPIATQQPIPPTEPVPAPAIAQMPRLVASNPDAPVATLTIEGTRYIAPADANLTCTFEAGTAKVTANGQITVIHRSRIKKARVVRKPAATGTTGNAS
ncbi:MAG TPA: hypothetical protein VD998_03865 [Verrucomicrobiae bacterium]|nr:hypothetical protein [Verrucomicrobiae bacterium]